MAYVVCEVSRGLRESERTISVKDVQGVAAYLRVPRDFIANLEQKTYLPIGIVGVDRKSGYTLIELPHESDSGYSRLWVQPDSILESTVKNA